MTLALATLDTLDYDPVSTPGREMRRERVGQESATVRTKRSILFTVSMFYIRVCV